MTATCYWCGAPKTSKEHVPPRCLFPKEKDAPQLGDQRKGLIKVPSCNIHNCEKSGDDEYLMCVLSVNILNNKVAETHVKSKIIRALKRSPGLMAACFGTHQDIAVSEDGGKTLQATAAVKIDDDRLERCLEHMARALFFYKYGKRHIGSVSCTPEFLVAITGQDAIERNAQYEEFRKLCDQAFENQPKEGKNPGVFFYQFHPNPPAQMAALLRMTFYEGAKATAIFYAQQNAQAVAG